MGRGWSRATSNVARTASSRIIIMLVYWYRQLDRKPVSGLWASSHTAQCVSRIISHATPSESVDESTFAGSSWITQLEQQLDHATPQCTRPITPPLPRYNINILNEWALVPHPISLLLLPFLNYPTTA